MNIVIHGHNHKITQELEEFVQKKVSKLDRYLPNITEVRVDLSRQPAKRGSDLAIAQITLRHSRGAILRSEEKMAIEDYDTIKAALTGALNKMSKRIDRFKGKRRDKRTRSNRYVATVEELNVAEEFPETEDIEYPEPGYSYDYEEEYQEIVRRKEVAVTAMNEEEAIQQMELLGHDFFMFFNMETNSINVLYRRSQGDYGVLVPQVE